MVACGPGVERIADEVAEILPEARIAVATSDTLNSPEKAADFVAQAEAKAEAQAEAVAKDAVLSERSDDEILSDLDLPQPEALTTPEDVRSFLAKEVPQRLKTRALRRLWRLNPVLANLDGLVDYGEDFTDNAMVIEGMKTAYQVGKGMKAHVDKLAAEAEAAEEAAKVAEDEPEADDAPEEAWDTADRTTDGATEDGSDPVEADPVDADLATLAPADAAASPSPNAAFSDAQLGVQSEPRPPAPRRMAFTFDARS